MQFQAIFDEITPNIWCYLVLISVINTLTKSQTELPGVVTTRPPPPPPPPPR